MIWEALSWEWIPQKNCLLEEVEVKLVFKQGNTKGMMLFRYNVCGMVGFRCEG